ncbi:hypothetical protein [Paenibacillus jilunlii]|nr:hypothetical protein [Paenibacillus jilunlii]
MNQPKLSSHPASTTAFLPVFPGNPAMANVLNTDFSIHLHADYTSDLLKQ